MKSVRELERIYRFFILILSPIYDLKQINHFTTILFRYVRYYCTFDGYIVIIV